MAAASIAGETGGIGIADNLIKPHRFLNFGCRTVSLKGRFYEIKILTGIESIFERRYQRLGLIPYAAVKISQKPVEVIVDLKIIAGRLVKQHPASAAEYLDVFLVIQRKALENYISQRFLPTDPAHKTVQSPSPPFSGRRVWAVSKCSNDFSRPRIAVLIPEIRCFMWAMVRRISCSVSA